MLAGARFVLLSQQNSVATVGDRLDMKFGRCVAQTKVQVENEQNTSVRYLTCKMLKAQEAMLLYACKRPEKAVA